LPSNSVTHALSLDACGEYESAAKPVTSNAMADRRFMKIFSQLIVVLDAGLAEVPPFRSPR
jgi:hypothetical protein